MTRLFEPHETANQQATFTKTLIDIVSKIMFAVTKNDKVVRWNSLQSVFEDRENALSSDVRMSSVSVTVMTDLNSFICQIMPYLPTYYQTGSTIHAQNQSYLMILLSTFFMLHHQISSKLLLTIDRLLTHFTLTLLRDVLWHPGSASPVLVFRHTWNLLWLE